VDSVRMFNGETGRLWCRITSGDPQVGREDSLKRSFKEHDMLYLIFHRSADSIIFLVPKGNLVAKGDSVRARQPIAIMFRLPASCQQIDICKFSSNSLQHRYPLAQDVWWKRSGLLSWEPADLSGVTSIVSPLLESRHDGFPAGLPLFHWWRLDLFLLLR
jgi:hypothetical protein